MENVWWKRAVVYQIYPRSFCDSNGDGIGDIPGILSKLWYLKELGVDVLWLSPVYRSPGDDGGYDVSGYREIDPRFGTLDDWDRLLREVHRNGMKLIMDLVVNHTSDEHPWFRESRKGRDNPFRDYYIWRDGREDGPPNNWASIFSGSAWERDGRDGQYYLHLFGKKQPDLNWRNPEVRREVAEIARFWLDRGVDGLRLDAINLIAKDADFPDARATAPEQPYQNAFPLHANLPEAHLWLHELREQVFSHYDCMAVGETSFVDPREGRRYCDPARGELDMVIHFEHMLIDAGADKWERREYRPIALKRVFTRWQYGLNGHGWNCCYLSNHDQPRQVSRFGDDGELRYESAAMLATLTMTMQGTPFLYQGEELGMTNLRMEDLDGFRDMEIKNWLAVQREQPGFDPEQALSILNQIGRDNARTPMQWTGGEQAGFTTGTPWLRVNPNYPRVNAGAQRENPHSVLAYYQKLITLRKREPALVFGAFHDLLPEHPDAYVYTRTLNGRVLLVLLNLTGRMVRLQGRLPKGEVLLSNYCGRPVPETSELLPYEAQIVAFDDQNP